MYSSHGDNMACCKAFLFTTACLITIALCAPADKDLIASDKEDLQTAASHWGGYGYGHYGGGYYPHYGGWGYPSYGYGWGWPYYGGYYGHGYWW